MFERVLVATDGSVFSNAALPFAADLARRYGAGVTVAHVLPDPAANLPIGPYMVDLAREDAALRERAAGVLEDAVAALGPNARPLLLQGRSRPVADVLADAARDERADLIVMSTHGRGGLARALLGSVAEAVLHRVKVPVLLVRPDGAPHPHAADVPAPVL